jgi:hypothetical protein
MLRPELLYDRDVAGIVRDIMKGRKSQAIKRLIKWADIWSTEEKVIAPEDMFADVMAKVGQALPSQRQILHGIEKWKAQGHADYYNFELAHKKLPIDEAIALQGLVIRRLENASSLLEELEG